MGVLSRREVLKAGAAAAALAATPAWAGPGRLIVPRGRGNRVAVLGGGMAGLAVAHELVERGFRVDVYERKALGGKARSIPVKGTAAGGRKPLPGEHGFRFFPGFYHHVPDSMRRIPFPGNPNGVWDNLVEANETKSPRTEGRADGTVFGIAPDPNEARTPDGMRRLLLEGLRDDVVPPHELAYFVERLMVFVTSCDERRYGQWEHVSWWDFIKAEGKSEEYQKVLARGLTRAVVAAKERKASTRTIGNMGEAFVYNIQQRGNDGAPDRVLNLPTNEAWIDPWVRLLRERGVRFHVGHDRRGAPDAGRDRSPRRVRVTAAAAAGAIEADWFVCAMPAERARRLWSPAVLRSDPSLELMNELYVDWMNGIQYYLNKPFHVIRGHLTFIDAPWAITALTQAQFWADRDFARDYGDGTPGGLLLGRRLRLGHAGDRLRQAGEAVHAEAGREGGLRADQAAPERQRRGDPHRRHGATRGTSTRRSSGTRAERRNSNAEPLLVNTVGTWEKRPQARTKIPNLFLAGDYVQTDVDLATMEGANEAGRDAANALLDAAGSKAEPAAKYKLYDPPEFEAAKAIDRELYKQGQPNALDKP